MNEYSSKVQMAERSTEVWTLSICILLLPTSGVNLWRGLTVRSTYAHSAGVYIFITLQESNSTAQINSYHSVSVY